MTFSALDEVKNQPHDNAPILGIQIRKGFYCPIANSGGKPCLHTVGKTSTLGTHIKTAHPGSRLHAKDLEAHHCDYQTLFIGNLKQYFRVRTGLTGHLDGDQNPYSVFVRQSNASPSPNHHPQPIKDNELPSLLRATGWNFFMEKYRKDPGDVVALVQYPSARALEIPDVDRMTEMVFRRLPDVCEMWMDTVHKYWKKSNDHVRRILARYPM